MGHGFYLKLSGVNYQGIGNSGVNMNEVCKHCGSILEEDEVGRYGGGLLCPICDSLGSISMFLHIRGCVGIATPSMFIDVKLSGSRVTMTAMERQTAEDQCCEF